MIESLTHRVRDLSRGLAEPTDSDVVHLRTLRAAIGFVALGLPFALLLGENLRDRLLTPAGMEDGAVVEASMSAYFHTGMRDVFVGSLCAIAIFLLCYKGPERRDKIAADVAGFSVLLVALFPTFERPREVAAPGVQPPHSLTLFSGADAADPRLVGYVHFGAAAVFFVTLAVMSLFLFTMTGPGTPTPRKLQPNRVFVVCGYTILACIALIAIDKVLLRDAWGEGTSFVFWVEAVAVVAFGVSWLAKAEVFLADRLPGAG